MQGKRTRRTCKAGELAEEEEDAAQEAERKAGDETGNGQRVRGGRRGTDHATKP
jgi:hypothetical protein